MLLIDTGSCPPVAPGESIAKGFARGLGLTDRIASAWMLNGFSFFLIGTEAGGAADVVDELVELEEGKEEDVWDSDEYGAVVGAAATSTWILNGFSLILMGTAVEVGAIEDEVREETEVVEEYDEEDVDNGNRGGGGGGTCGGGGTLALL